MVIYREQWVIPDYLPLTDTLNGWWQVRVGDRSHGDNAYDWLINARLIYGRGWISRVFICCATLTCEKSYYRNVIMKIVEIEFPWGGGAALGPIATFTIIPR